MLHLSSNIKYIRELANKTQYDFANMFAVKDKKGNLSPDKIYTYESRRAKPPKFFLEALSEYAGITVDALENVKLTKKDITFKPYDPNIVSNETNITNDDGNTDNFYSQGSLSKKTSTDFTDKYTQSLEKQIVQLEKIQDSLERRLNELERCGY
jgi:transcriptional regulator with XRE-family HTH domain